MKKLCCIFVLLLAFGQGLRAIDRETYLRNTGALNGDIVSEWTAALNAASGESISRNDVFIMLPSIEVLFTNGKFLNEVSQRLLGRMEAIKSRTGDWQTTLNAATGSVIRPANVVLFLVQYEALFNEQSLIAPKEEAYLAALKALSPKQVSDACQGRKFEESAAVLWPLIEEKFLSQSPTAMMLSNPNPPATGTAPASPRKTRPSIDFSQYGKHLVVIEGNESSGSGFIVKLKGNVLVATNAHVLSGNDTVKLSLLNSTKVDRGTMGIARDYDLAVITQTQLKEGLEIMYGVENEAKMGDDVVVLGNSQGSKVITELWGKITGIGPDLVEVDAKFVQGNSGSPIIHAKSGKVIGIATYAEKKDVDWITKDSKFTDIRRFGYRLDTVPGWQYPKWEAFQQEAKTVAGIEQHTGNLITMLRDIYDNAQVSFGVHQGNGNRLRTYVTEFAQSMGRPNVAPATRQDAKLRFLRALTTEAVADLNNVRADGFSDYHGKILKEQIELRKLIKKEFEKIASIQTTAGRITLP